MTDELTITSPFTPNELLDLAQNASARRNVYRFAQQTAWLTLGVHAPSAQLWGEFPVRAKPPFHTRVALDGSHFTCACNQRRFPCAHTLALYLLWLEQPVVFSQVTPTWWTGELSTATQARHRFTPTVVSDTNRGSTQSDQQAYNARRLANAQSGLAELAQRLQDLVQQGLADLPQRSPTFWKAMAARLVDAQVGEVAQEVLALATIAGAHPDWPEQLVARMGRLHLLTEAMQRFETLPLPLQNDLSEAVGWSPQWDETSPLAVTDRWHVVGRQLQRQRNQLRQCHWLWGETSNRPALLVSYAHGTQQIETRWPTGRVHDATLHFYPSMSPLRAEMATVAQPDDLQRVGLRENAVSPIQGDGSIGAAMRRYRQNLSQHPWRTHSPILVEIKTLEEQHGAWWLVDANQELLPVTPGCEQIWHLLALCHATRQPEAEQPAGLSLFGIWNGSHVEPLSVWHNQHNLPLDILGGIK